MKLFFKELGKASFIGSLVFIILGIIQYLNGYREYDGFKLLIEFGYNQLYAVVLYMSNMYFIRILLERYKGELFRFENLAKGIAGGMVITLSSIFLIRLSLKVFIAGKSLSEFISGEQIQFYTVVFIIAAVVTSVFYGMYYYRFSHERTVKEQKIIAGTASAKFDALKNQLDPHFLFNSLNVLTSLIEENPKAATKFTTLLSKVYRYVLEQKNKELVTIKEELNFARQYMSLINMRFEDSIIFTLPETISNPEAKVVPLALQLILENAVKHNQVTPTKKLHITVYERHGNLVVKNNLQPKQVMKESSGVGLQNIRQRYYLVTDRPIRIEQDNNEFSISIPMLTKEITTMKTQESYLSDKRYERAKKKVKDMKGFYIHLVIYLLMLPVFVILNLNSTHFPWALFPIIGWGIGLTGHAMEVFNYNPILGKDWEEKKIREFMEEDNFKNN